MTAPIAALPTTPAVPTATAAQPSDGNAEQFDAALAGVTVLTPDGGQPDAEADEDGETGPTGETAILCAILDPAWAHRPVETPPAGGGAALPQTPAILDTETGGSADGNPRSATAAVAEGVVRTTAPSAADARTPDVVAVATVAAPRADAATPTTSVPVPPAPAPPPPAAQLAVRLAPLRSGPDGTHSLTIHLNPEELGPISVVAQVRGDELSVHLTGATDAGRDALRAGIPQLERELRDSGFVSCAVDVGRDTAQDRSGRPAWTAGDDRSGGLHGGRQDGQEGAPQGSPGRSGRGGSGRGEPGAPGTSDRYAGGRNTGPTTATRSLDLHV
jgi:hypothetical protein